MLVLFSLAARALHAQPNRIFGLDLLRAAAILSVVYGQAGLLLPLAYQPGYALPGLALDGGAIFFVLSGYLVGGILLRALADAHAPFSLRHFWQRRWLRTLPAYGAVLLGLVAVGGLLHQLPEGLWRYFCFSQNLTTPSPDFFPEAWSLAVIEWFYLLFPVVVVVLVGVLGSRRLAVAAAIGLFLLGPLAFRYYQYQQGQGLSATLWDAYCQRIVAARLDTLALGVLASYLQHYHAGLWRALRRPGLVLAAGLLLALLPGSGLGGSGLLYHGWLRPLLAGLAVVLLLPHCAQWRSARPSLAHHAVTLLSLVSFSAYLLHKSVLLKLLLPLEHTVITPYLGLPGWLVAYGLYWVLLLSGALLLYTYVERPFRQLHTSLGRPRPAAPVLAVAGR